MNKLVIIGLSCVVAVGCAEVGVGDYAERSGPYDGGPSSPPGYADSSTGAPTPGPDAEEDPTGNEGDRYEYVGTNPFVSAAHDPFSTFAADVDTASYDIFRRDVSAGLLPSRESVRLEEYVNAFPYDYPAPAFGAEIPFTIDLAAANHAMGRGITQLRVGIQAATPPEFAKLPTNLVYLVDVSGSMDDPAKLPLAKLLMEYSLDVLDGTDTVSIVTYSGGVSVALPPTRATEREAILEAIAPLSAYGSTAGASAMDLAYDQAAAGYIEGGFNHVIMLTDGDFNVGVSSDDALVALIEEKRLTGVTLTALGFGRGNLNDSMMERVSNAGNGTYSVIVSGSHAREYAENGLLAAVNLVAQDMKIQVEFNPDHVVAYRLLGYENRAIADSDFRVDSVDAGEVGAGHRVTALYEVVLNGQTMPAIDGAPEATDGDPVDGQREVEATEFVQVRVRWKDLGASPEDAAYETSSSLIPADVVQPADADEDFLWAAAICAFAEILKESPFADQADLETIETIVTAQASLDDDRARFVELFTAARAMIAPTTTP